MKDYDEEQRLKEQEQKARADERRLKKKLREFSSWKEHG